MLSVSDQSHPLEAWDGKGSPGEIIKPLPKTAEGPPPGSRGRVEGGGGAGGGRHPSRSPASRRWPPRRSPESGYCGRLGSALSTRSGRSAWACSYFEDCGSGGSAPPQADRLGPSPGRQPLPHLPRPARRRQSSAPPCRAVLSPEVAAPGRRRLQRPVARHRRLHGAPRSW